MNTENQKKSVEILNQVSDNKLDPKLAVDQLVELGSGRADAEELVFIAQGGDDVIEIDEL